MHVVLALLFRYSRGFIHLQNHCRTNDAEDLVHCRRDALCPFCHNRNREESFNAMIDIIEADVEGTIGHTLEVDKVNLSPNSQS